MGYTIPFIVFMTKIGINTSFQTAYQASFGENCIYPFYKRATAIGINNLIARCLTIPAPICAELQRPIPAILLLTVTGLALISAIFLPSYSEEVAYEQGQKKLADEALEAGNELEEINRKKDQ